MKYPKIYNARAKNFFFLSYPLFCDVLVAVPVVICLSSQQRKSQCIFRRVVTAIIKTFIPATRKTVNSLASDSISISSSLTQLVIEWLRVPYKKTQGFSLRKESFKAIF